MDFINDLHFQFTELVADKYLKPFAYLLSKRHSEGNICIDLEKENFDEEYNSWSEDIQKRILPFSTEKLLKATAILSLDEFDKKPFIIFNNKLYTYRYFKYETQIIDKINQLIANEKEALSKRKLELQTHKHVIAKLQDTNLEITDWQLVACLNSYLNNFSIITGGPGTGKTTTIAKFLALLYTSSPDLKVALAAPTGKAAIRMVESLKNNRLAGEEPLKSKIEELEGTTIHRLLGYQKNSNYFKYNAENSLDYDVIIVDEASMIDVPMLAKLLAAIDPTKRFILLGDKNQLASVEAGSMLGDLCNSAVISEEPTLNIFSDNRKNFLNKFLNASNTITSSNTPVSKCLNEHITELMLVRRITEEAKVIGQLSKAIIQEDVEEVNKLLKQDFDNLKVDTNYDNSVFENCISGYRAYIEEKDIKCAIEKLNAIRVLCAVREGKNGIYATNRKIETYLQTRKLLKLNSEDYENRPILVNKNNKELNLFNGDVGIIRTNAKGHKRAYFTDKNKEIREIVPTNIGSYDTVFAMTIHKSQGSEFDEVVIILPEKQESKMLNKELLYTAVTRARKKLTIQGTTEIILQTIQTRVKRTSGIMDRINI